MLLVSLLRVFDLGFASIAIVIVHFFEVLEEENLSFVLVLEVLHVLLINDVAFSLRLLYLSGLYQ